MGILLTPLWTPFIGLDAMTVIGAYSILLTIVMASSPLAVMGTVIRQKSTESMPFIISFAMFMNSLAWLLYGWFVVIDYNIWIPNVWGLAASIIQLSLFVIYPSKKKENDFIMEAPSLSSIPSAQSDPGVAV